MKTAKEVLGNTVICRSPDGCRVRSVSVGDVILIWVADRFSPDGKATLHVEVACVSSGQDAADLGDLGFCYRNEHGEPAQDFVSVDEVIQVWRQVT